MTVFVCLGFSPEPSWFLRATVHDAQGTHLLRQMAPVIVKVGSSDSESSVQFGELVRRRWLGASPGLESYARPTQASRA